ncbi:hypothetical protein [Streptosporangium roseum]|uniref:Uncharacterized protein n=1 Tax=Streptosporangium roseum (strain ATCC 12428 / DSM 43021 / JCM 3005 / KCTC 9067 / NCIMB 10171 / NRRL 2505 / NI 9100) TaxID=479432 RepID=D2BEJ1_STRRD|nr:hypothetical protein [Streptosporangium roseum]ACZ84354.1 hypothetical protein Sros_1359 [Streptosporangium roseum DSM 43021]
MTNDQRHGRRRQGRSHVTRPVGILVSALAVGAGFGAATSLVNALSNSYADLESRAYTTGGWSIAEIMSVLLDSGWAWAGLAVAVGWLVTRARESGPAALAQGGAAGALALLAATAAYSVVDAVRSGGQVSWYESEPLLWWVASVVLGAPLGAVGVCVRRSGAIGLLARLTVPVGAAVQMVVLPPGRNEVVETMGKTIVWTAAAAIIGFVVVRFLLVERRRRSPAAAESP